MGEGEQWENAPMQELPFGKAEALLEGSSLAVISTGPVSCRALEAAQSFPGLVGVYHFPFVKPLDTDMLESIATRYNIIVTAEDGCIAGGLFGAVSEYMAGHGHAVKIVPAGIPDKFVFHDSQARQRSMCNLDREGMEKIFQKFLEIPK